MELYAHPETLNTGEQTTLEQYKGKVLLIVNTASKCGFTPQFEGLEQLNKNYSEKGLVVIGFPCNQFGKQDPGDMSEITKFCQLNYGVSFTMAEKIDVNGNNAHPLFNHLKSSAKGILGSEGIKWNFTKFLISRDGEVLRRFAPSVKPSEIATVIEAAL